MSITTVMVSAVALAALGSTAYEWNRAFRAETELATLTADRDGLRAQLTFEQQHAKVITGDLAVLRGEIETLKTRPGAATSVRATVAASTDASELSISDRIRANLRQISAARDQFELEQGRPPRSVDDLVGPDKYIKRLIAVNGESYAGLSMARLQPLVVATPDGISVSYDSNDPAEQAIHGTPRGVPLQPAKIEALTRATELKSKTSASLEKAVAAYKAAHNNQVPLNREAYIPYFESPQEGADFVEFLDAVKAATRK
jgi:hypothetical protein